MTEWDGGQSKCPDGVTPICSRDVRGRKASDWRRVAGACLRQLPTMRLSLTVSRLESREPGRVRTGRAREAGDGAAEPRQQHAARMETGVKFARAALARTMLFHNTRRQASHASIHANNQHPASATSKQTKQSRQPSHQSITLSQHATATHHSRLVHRRVPERGRPAGRRHCAVPQRRTSGFGPVWSRRGWRRYALGGRKQGDSGPALFWRCLRRPKSLPQGAAQVRRHGDDSVTFVCASPVGRDRRQHAKALRWQPDAPAPTTRLL